MSVSFSQLPCRYRANIANSLQPYNVAALSTLHDNLWFTCDGINAVEYKYFCGRCDEIQQRFRREGAAVRIQALWRACVLKHNLSAFVRIGKRTRAIRIQRVVRVALAQRELHKRKEAFKIRSAAALRPQTVCFSFCCV